MGTKVILPRKSVVMAIIGAIIVFGTIGLITFDTYGYRSLGLFGWLPIVIGVALTLANFRGD